MKDFNFYLGEIKKSIKDNTLDYFKKKLFAILNEQEKLEEAQNSKNLDHLEKSMIKTLIDVYGLQKGTNYPIGTVREWKGEKYRKIAPGKWRKIYDSNTRGARQSIRMIKSKIINAKPTDELLEIVMQNVNRFQDADGNLLPIVEELKKEVNKKKSELNSGKPSTQQQIDDFKKKNSKSLYDTMVKPDLENAKNYHEKYNDYFKQNFENDEKKLEAGNKLLDKMKDVKNTLNKYQERFWNNELDISGDEFDEIQTQVARINSDIYMFENNLKTLKEKIENQKEADNIKKVNVDNLTDEEKEGIRKFQERIDNFVEERANSGNLWSLRQDLINFSRETTDALSGQRYMKLNDVKNFDEFYMHIYNKIQKGINKKKADKEKEKIQARKDKIDEINKASEKTFTDAEIKKAFSEMDHLMNEKNELLQQLKANKVKDVDNKRARSQREMDIKFENGQRRLRGEEPISYWNDDKYNELKNETTEIWREANSIRAKVALFEEKIDKLMDPIAYHYLNNFDYEKDETINNCNSTNDVIDLIKSKDWYSDKGKGRIELQNVDIEASKDIFKVLEHTFAIFPEQKGQDFSLRTMYSNSRTWATGGTAITFNRKYWNDYASLNESYESTEGSFHPMGTTAKDIIYHEYYHVMTIGNLAKKIKENVTKRLKMKGKKGGPKQDEIIKFGISEYALKDADEFGAESFCQALGSKNPTAFAKEVFKETLKYKKYMRGLV